MPLAVFMGVADKASCRKCDKEFNLLFHRSRRCNHCGYFYCSSCSSYQALMPREAGYDPVQVCGYCIEYLTLTAAGRSHLRSLPIAKLKKYVDAYNLKADGAVEKDDLVEIIMSARTRNGCLPYANEDYYRKHSVPNRTTIHPRGFFSRNPAQDQPPPPQTGPRPRQSNGQYFPRPDLEPQWHPQPPPPSPRPPPPRHFQPTSTGTSPRPQSTFNHPPYAQYRPPPHTPRTEQHSATRQAPSPNLHVPTPNAQTRPRATSAGPSASPPPPCLDRLLEMAPEDISSLPISMLKSILFQNHVNARLIIEKSDLVKKVKVLIDEERKHREREAMFREREEEAERGRQRERLQEMERERQAYQEEQNRDLALIPAETRASPEINIEADGTIHTPEASDEVQTPNEDRSKSPATPPKRRQSQVAMESTLERTGLCVICQDEEANIAIVDCGHMAMCRGCSDLIMSSTRECPLCRTRIVTEARLLRIFKA